jgi:hypothetical protein
MDIAQLKNEIKSIYLAYEPIDGGSLPSELKYYQEIVNPCLEHIPEFSPEELLSNL